MPFGAGAVAGDDENINHESVIPIIFPSFRPSFHLIMEILNI